MSLVEIYGPTVTLKEMLGILNFRRSSYYNYVNPTHHLYKPSLPAPMQEFGKKIFVTSEIEKYLNNR